MRTDSYECHPECPVRLLDDGANSNVSRFFYTAKVSTRERHMGGINCLHPTLKPISLCTYLARLLLPPQRDQSSSTLSPRRLLIPFSGAGSEVIGGLRSGWDEIIGIENDPQSVQWAEARIAADSGEEISESMRQNMERQPESESQSQSQSQSTRRRRSTYQPDASLLNQLLDADNNEDIPK